MDKNEAEEKNITFTYVYFWQTFSYETTYIISSVIPWESITLVLLGPSFNNWIGCAFVYLGVCHSAVKQLKKQLYHKII